MRLDTFKIEEWMNTYCPSAEYDLTSTCIKPLSIRELMTLSGIQKPLEIFDEKLTYGEIHGSLRLKEAIKGLYENQTVENITVTHGAIGANQLVFHALLEKGDEVVCLLPAYQQHYSLPKSLGVNVKQVFLKEENKWQPNLNEIEKANDMGVSKFSTIRSEKGEKRERKKAGIVEKRPRMLKSSLATMNKTKRR